MWELALLREQCVVGGVVVLSFVVDKTLLVMGVTVRLRAVVRRLEVDG